MPARYEKYPRIAIITGADSGIGKACAVALAAAGFDIGITWQATPRARSEPPRRYATSAGAVRSANWT